MILENQIYFEALHEDRKESANFLERSSLRGIKKSVVEKYSDQAHFIYELLQNADDAKATSVHFELHLDKLIFSHNGTRRFTISNPQTEDLDRERGKLGDLNAITSIGQSNKVGSATDTEIDSKIGKFGVGFKAVFQYTSTPHIYDPGISFKIERFIVPVKLTEDYEGRKATETVFVFPFDDDLEQNKEKAGKEKAFTDISDKLRSLDYPTLFLTNLEKINYDILGEPGSYHKLIHEKTQLEQQTSQILLTLKQTGVTEETENLWLFSRKNENGQTYSVGFFVDEKGQLMKKDYPAFCFFPTKATTNLNFILHAPFLLTDSREGIRAGLAYNDELIDLLAKLAADSLIYLRDTRLAQGINLITENIFDIIPYDSSEFSEITDKRNVSFKPFYEEIFNKMKNEELLLTEVDYIKAERAYWADVPKIAEIISNKQLEAITNVEQAQWLYFPFGHQETSRINRKLTAYIKSLGVKTLDEKGVIHGMTSTFIEQQPLEWLHQFYHWVAETTGRTNLVKQKPIFLNQEGKAVAVLDQNKQVILFLPTETPGYETVLPELLKNTRTVEFLKQLDVKKPTLRDEIYNHILPLYKEDEEINTDPHFIKFFNYYKECSKKESEDFIKLIKKYKFIKCKSASDDIVRRGEAQMLYLPTKKLKKWFEVIPEEYFVLFDEYLEIVGESNKQELIQFFVDLKVNIQPKIVSISLDFQEAEKLPHNWKRSTRYREWHENCLDGGRINLKVISEQKDKERSLLLWEVLRDLNNPSFNRFSQIADGIYRYFFQNGKAYTYKSSELINLCNQPWLVNKHGEFVAPKDVTVEELAEEYEVDTPAALELLNVLGIQHAIRADVHLTEAQRKAVQLMEEIKDIPEDELKRFIEQYREKQKNKEQNTSQQPSRSKEILGEIDKYIKKSNSGGIGEDKTPSKNPQLDEDEYTKPSIDVTQKIEHAKKQSAAEITEIIHLDKLMQQVNASNRYSFGWFKALLDLEAYQQGGNTYTKEISINFSKVEREADTSRILILKHPNRYIPHSIEDLSDIPLDLLMKDGQTIRVVVEVVNVKSYTLRAKLKPNAQLDTVDLTEVKEAKIEAKNPAFLLDELIKAFNKLSLEPTFDMKANLCRNIDFIFGPPGTGKTTYLAKDIILSLIKEAEAPKILVLTPTNKAADVLARRIMDIDTEQSYKDWLVRFGTTNDTVIEEQGVFYDKSVDIQDFSKNVTVTTIARFPYDFFLPTEGKRLYLNEMKWDYIIIDEASMIPLVNIIYPLYKKTPTKFIIAGDPFQIEPITSLDTWKNENIYTMVKLDSFTNPQTVPHNYNVKLLTKQYRSVPEIGEVFSKLTYGGVLEHHRASKDSNLHLDSGVTFQALNIVKFPVSKYESIYCAKRLQNKSSYHIYSALFTFEYVKHIATSLKHPFRIGIIAPYRAQADLLDKLIASYVFPSMVEIQVGTIHGFQGDECDMIIALFNPPPTISTSSEMFLNKLNIINVAISRARDYLVMIMPDDEVNKVENLKTIKSVERLCQQQENYNERHTSTLEKIIFDSETYLEDNSFSTSHQLVNVYSQPEKKYEIRSESNAVDLQIHE